ncbi:MAG: hypothetical protein GKC05_03760 [Methanomicrobiales archaeon]|nr:hypothetical protein [Methanomicrobiales archaeon]NYT21453.1 hypothetical protein [Methanomicrobiales archaeon]
MSLIDEFLEPLAHGVWEVIVPKQSVPGPLDPEWQISGINIPSPGTIASFRKGRYHAHETKTEWRVHLDNHDPKNHPILHLIDDAPLLLMIGDTFITLVSGARITTGDQKMILEGQERAWQEMTLIGLALILIGLFIITNPYLFFRGIIHLAIPLLTIAIGLVTVHKGVKIYPPQIRSGSLLALGVCIVAIGIIAFSMPLAGWITLITGTLAVWMFASAIILLWRARGGRTAIPEGFSSRIAIALVSLLLVVLIFLNPIGILVLLVTIIGWIAFFPGLVLVVNGIRLKKRMAR